MNLKSYLESRTQARLVMVGNNSVSTLIFSKTREKKEEHLTLSSTQKTFLELVVVAARCGWGAQLGKGDDAQLFYPDHPSSSLPAGCRGILLSQARFVGIAHIQGGFRAVEGIVIQKGMLVESSAQELVAGACGWVTTRREKTGDDRWPVKALFALTGGEKLKELPPELRPGGRGLDALMKAPEVVSWASAWGPAPWERKPDPLHSALDGLLESLATHEEGMPS